jgi:Kdo2-lipid IVA lauroyltransferase/acyltransferase
MTARRKAEGKGQAAPRGSVSPAQRPHAPVDAAAPTNGGDGLSLAHFWAPRHWPTWLLLGGLLLAARLPFRIQLAIGRGLGSTLFVLGRRRRRIAAVNLAACFPELSREQRRRLLRSHFEAIGISVVELAMAWFGPIEKLRKLVRVEGFEHIARVRVEGRAPLLLTAHFTPLDVGFAIFTGVRPGFSAMYRSQRNAMIDVLIRRGRRRFTEAQIPRDNVRALVKAMRQGRTVVYLPDQTYVGNQSALLPFFGEPAMTNIAVTKLAQIGNARVLPYLIRRLPGTDGYEVKIGPPLDDVPSDDPIGDTRKWLDALEAHIRAAPEQYLWIYKKFKSRPPPLPDPYRGI